MSLQLFPPPPRPRRSGSRKRPVIKPMVPEPVAEKMESAKSPDDLHELIIRVNSVPTSPIKTPEQAHFPQRTPPQQSSAFAGPSDRPRTASPVPSLVHDRTPSGSSGVPSPKSERAPSPTLSPERARVASPAFSELRSVRSGSPTLVRSNSAATSFYRTRDIHENVPMQSIFPTYDPTIPLAHQNYRPTQVSPTHIPKEIISRSPYSPTFYVPHSNVQAESSTAASARPRFTPVQDLPGLWDAANAQDTPIKVGKTFTLEMHRPSGAESHPTPSSSKSPALSVINETTDITFGPSEHAPFYTLSQPPVSPNPNLKDDPLQEILITRQNPDPRKPQILPMSHLSLRAPPPIKIPKSSKGKSAEDGSPTETLVTTIYPKLAAITALELAAQSPAASSIALVDPEANSPAARALAEEAVQEAAVREACALVHTTTSPENDYYGPASPNPYTSQAALGGEYELHHPSLGIFPIAVEGYTATSLGAESTARIALLNPFINTTMSPLASPGFGSISAPCSPGFANQLSPGLPTAQPLTPGYFGYGYGSQSHFNQRKKNQHDVLARLDLSNNSLTIDTTAIGSFGNRYLVDTAVSAVLAVAAAEGARGGKPKALKVVAKAAAEEAKLKEEREREMGLRFDGPPTLAARGGSPKPKPKAVKEPAAATGNGKKAKKHWWSRSHSKKSKVLPEVQEIDIEIRPIGTTGTAADPTAEQQDRDEEKLPWITQAILGVLGFAFKAVVVVLGFVVRIVAGAVVSITRVAKKL